MAKRRAASAEKWFDNCGGWRPQHDLNELRRGIAAGWLDEQDEYGMTALHLAVASGWLDGVTTLLQAGADTELWHFRTGTTPLYTAVQERNSPIVAALVAAGANPDALNHWGLTPHTCASETTPAPFDRIPIRETPRPPPLIQNAEHLADHHHPRFKIPAREERETIRVGQAVDLYVYGPKSEAKQDTVKVRIMARNGRRPHVRYTAVLETPVERTHLTEGTTVVEFGPEHIASVYVPWPTKGKA